MISRSTRFAAARLAAAMLALTALAPAGMAQTPADDKAKTPPAQPAAPAQPVPAAPAKAPEEKTVNVIMSTSMGDVTIELYRDKAPVTVDNFLKYVDDKFYDGTVFHRVIPTFMIQGGGFITDGKSLREKQNKRPPIKNEWKNGLKNTTGTIAMARTSDPDSATCQFFINTKDNAFLSEPQPGQPAASFVGYCVFGKVTSGMDVVDKIKAVPTARTMFSEAQPLETVEIKSIRRAEAKVEAKPDAAKKGG